jgi:hypothetical protein
MIEPGLYKVYENNIDGYYTNAKFIFKLNNRMNLKEIALKLMKDKGYISSWTYLAIRPVKQDDVYTIN